MKHTKTFLITIFVFILLLNACTLDQEREIKQTSEPTSIQTPIDQDGINLNNLRATATPTSLPCPPPEAELSPSNNYIGLLINDDFEDLQFFDNLMIEDSERPNFWRYGVTHGFDGTNNYLLLKEFVCSKENGVPVFRVIDEIKITTLKEDEFIFAAACNHSTLENHIVAIGYYEQTSDGWRIQVTQGWIVDLQNSAFVALPSDELSNIKCIEDCPTCNQGYK